MKQILQNPRSGALELAEVPPPAIEPGQVLVRTRFSVVSPGTEKLALEFARSSLLAKARRRPDLVRQIASKVRRDGIAATLQTVQARLDVLQPLGYSSAGIVEAVGERVERIRVGDRVACAGAGYANHAELAAVPENLVAPVPDGVSLEDAAFATVGAIALQGVRIARPELGEVVVVIGLGLIGQLTVQLLRANGCRVLGIDVDAHRAKQALEQGARWSARPGDDLDAWVDRETDGFGADAVIVTASSETAAPIELGARLSRLRGRLVVVGALPLTLDRRVFYEKELELRLSRSYGPGRYDRGYEERGHEYPLPYVRWTENRNLRAFLSLIQDGAVQPSRLDVATEPFERAVQVYDELAGDRRRSVGVLYRYEGSAEPQTRSEPPERETRPVTVAPGRPVGIGFVGAGQYARSVLLPALPGAKDARRVALATATGSSARHAAHRFRFERGVTDPEDVLGDPHVSLVFVATRHDSHAGLAVRALRAGKAVWVEKPLALRLEEVEEVATAVRREHGFLVVGFNRRFSPHARMLRDAFASRRGPLAIRYSVAAGPAPTGTWITDPEVGGGRIVGEVCHFVDLCGDLVGDRPVEVFARPVGAGERDDSVVVLLSYPDGSTASIEYLARASGTLPKERIEVSGDGRTGECLGFRRTRIHGTGGARIRRSFRPDKGQRAALGEVIDCVAEGRPAPIPLEEIVSVSRASFAILESARSGRPVKLER